MPFGPYPSEKMNAYPVSTPVNRPSNDDPRCVEPIAPPPGQPDRLDAHRVLAG